jgi:hypothetical protein
MHGYAWGYCLLSVRAQALNVLMLKTLENSNRTYAFTALLLLTREPPQELRHKPPEAAKFFDLAVKCLIKISKALSDDLQVRLVTHMCATKLPGQQCLFWYFS